MASLRGSLVVAALVLGITAHATAQIKSEVVASGFRNPLAVVADPLDPDALLVVEQGGLIRVVRDGTVLQEPFLDLRNQISSGGERGLLGLAIPPDGRDSRRVFVNFTDPRGDTVVARFKRREDNSLVADRDSRFDLVWPGGARVIDQPFSNHNGGHLAFGPDGYLYIGMGDGGSGGDPQNHAQNPRSLLGKMLRIDVSVPDDHSRGYRVPEDNPFIDGDPIDALAEIWAFGLRNPWRYSFDDWTRGGIGAMLLGDVGQDQREEIDFEPRGAGGRNYAWRQREGRRTYDSRAQLAYGPAIEPIHDYSHAVGQSVTGGFIYRGAALDPRYNGRYVFADFSGRVFSIGLHVDADTREATADDEQEHTEAMGGRDALGLVSSFGVDRNGELLILNWSAGRVLRVVPDFGVVPRAPAARAEWIEDEVRLEWTVEGDVPAVSFDLEVVESGAVVARMDAGSERAATLRPTAEQCVRVRARGRDGAGPPSPLFCRPAQ